MGMLYFYPQNTGLRGSLPNSINTSFFVIKHHEIIVNHSGNIGIIDWYRCLQRTTDTTWADIQHLVDTCDHIVLVSTEEFWPMHTTSRANAETILGMLNDYSIIYHCNHHDRVQDLGVHNTWQPWLCRPPVIDYDYEPGDRDYDFASLLGRRKQIRDQIADVLCEYNALVNYAGRDHTNIDFDVSGFYSGTSQSRNNNTIYDKWNNQPSSFYQQGDNIDISCLVPETVYSQSHMDIISETFPRNQFTNSVLLTEKTARSIAHGRLFRTLGHNGYLGELIRCGFEPLPIWRSDHDEGTPDDCWNSFVADLNEYSGNDFEMLYDECARELQHNKNVYQYLIKHYPNQIHKHFELIK